MSLPVRIRIRDVLQATAEVTGVPVADIIGAGRYDYICEARFIAYFVARYRLGRLYTEIGKAMGRDRSSVYAGTERMRERLLDGTFDASTIDKVEALASELAGRRRVEIRGVFAAVAA